MVRTLPSSMRTALLTSLEMPFASGIPLLVRKIISGKSFPGLTYRSKRNGYSICCSNYNKGYIAATEYGLNPEVHIYKYPGKELVHKFKCKVQYPNYSLAEATVEIIDLAFSRDSKRLLMISGIPDFKISIFDLENNKMLSLQENLKNKPHIKAKFNPSNTDSFAILSKEKIIFYSIHKAYSITEGGSQDIMDKCQRVSVKEFVAPTEDMNFVTFIWD
jgi:hypothetical protein